MSYRGFDWILFFAIVGLGCMSLALLSSAAPEFASKQLLFYGILLLLILFGSQIKWSSILRQSIFVQLFYWGSLVLLLFAFFEGTVVRGARSWIIIGGNQFQPSELAKIALILILAGFFMKRYIAAWNFKNIFLSFLYVAIPGGIIALQPDFGSAMVVFGIWVGFLLMSGMHVKRFFMLAGACVLGFVCLWSFVLMPYQKDRITGFMSPERDPLGINYNIIQSKIAIGSAGFFGKGFGEGTQIHFNFLPEFHADFFFAAFVEEWGILGGIALISLYFLIIHRVLLIGRRSKTNDAKFIALGTSTLLVIHFLVNIGSNLGIVPVTGITLPFLSYGGSSLLTLGLLMGIIENIRLESSN